MLHVGHVIDGKYKLLRLVGDGGMGSVYEAEHMMLGTRVAVKILHPDMAKRPGLIERFLQEARVSARLRSPHIVQVSDVDRTPDGTAFMVMEILAGEPLSRAMDRDRAFPISRAIDFTIQMLEGLEVAHAMGVVHRDLKPENVFLVPEMISDRQGTLVKLIDFGIAKLKRSQSEVPENLTMAGTLMGTAEYMAPEQAYSADQVDARADLYAVGVMLFEMLAGMRPVDGDDPRIVVLKVQRGEVRRLGEVCPHLPPELVALVHKAMTPRLEGRFSSATEMRLALAPFRHGAGQGGQYANPIPAHLAPSPFAPTPFAPTPFAPERGPAPAQSPAAVPAQGGTTEPAHGPHAIAPVQLPQPAPRAGQTQMGEPVGFGPHGPGGPGAHPAPQGLGSGLGGQGFQGHAGPPYPQNPGQGSHRPPQYSSQPRKRGGGRTTLIVLAVLIGIPAGGLCMWAVFDHVSPETPAPSSTLVGGPVTPPQTATTPTASISATDPLPSLNALPPLQTGGSSGNVGPVPTGSARPPPSATATTPATGSATGPFPPIPGFTASPTSFTWGTSGGPSVTIQLPVFIPTAPH